MSIQEIREHSGDPAGDRRVRDSVAGTEQLAGPRSGSGTQIIIGGPQELTDWVRALGRQLSEVTDGQICDRAKESASGEKGAQ